MIDYWRIEREWVGKYIHHRNLLNKGRNELSWFTDILKIFGVAGGIAFSDAIVGNWVMLIIAAIIYLLVCYGVGFWWEKRHHFETENEWGNERNPFVKEVLSNKKSIGRLTR
jgi:ABC-type phosphate transport system permease subunit